MFSYEPFATSAGYIQSGEAIRAKIDMTDPVTRERCAKWKNRVYLGQTPNGRAVILNPFTNEKSVLMIGRVRKI